MSTSETLLGLLAAGPRHGYELKREHDTHFPQARPLAFGQVYATLSRLSRRGLINEGETVSDGGPERKSYELTQKGKTLLLDWLGTTVPPAPHVTNEMFTKVVTALLVTGSGRAYLAKQRAAHLARMRELTAIKTDPNASLSDVLSADYALLHLDADMRWMRTTSERLSELAKEVLQ